MRADQVVTMSDGTTQTIRGIGGMHYVRWRGHQHWHFDEFMRYELRSFDGKALVATDEKRGFCLGDRLNLDIFTQAVNEPRSPVFRTNCGWHLPGLLHVHEGISVGNADFYTPQLEGQDIDVTNIPSGEYWLVHTANPARRLRESDYSNDSSSVLLRFAWKRVTAYRRRLVVTPLIDCPGAARCNPPSSSGAAAARTRALALRTTSAGRPLSVTPGVTRVSALSFVCHLR
jgi:hypothetical protein